MRIVSLLPSATEIVCALGFGDSLVGRSHECDYPEYVQHLPVCTAATLDTRAASSDIDAQVRERVGAGLALYQVLEDTLKALDPDVVVTQSQCRVCAVTPEDLEAAMGQWLRSHVRVVSLEPNNLDDVWNDIRHVAAALDAPERGEEVASQLKECVAALEQQARRLPNRPTVACIEWTDPLMGAGNWVPELVARAGGENLFGRSGEHSPSIPWEDLRVADPEVILVQPCGFDLARTRQEMAPLTRHPDWPDLRAVREGRVILADGNHYFNRPGPRLAESAEILAEALHPEAFRFGHKGSAWTYI